MNKDHIVNTRCRHSYIAGFPAFSLRFLTKQTRPEVNEKKKEGKQSKLTGSD